MSKSEHIRKLRRLLSHHRVMAAAELMERLSVSRATLSRYLAELRDRQNMPIAFDRAHDGYRLTSSPDGSGGLYELSVWFTADEILALLTMQRLLDSLDSGGLLDSHIAPLRARLIKMLGAAKHPADEIVHRVRLIPLGARRFEPEHFQMLGSALLQRQRLQIEYHAREKNEVSRREISPQRLTHYRDNWYLDAWCHRREGLRTFALDCVRPLHLLDEAALDVAEEDLDRELGSGYGIFAGSNTREAVLQFDAHRSRWIAKEQWHPQQRLRELADGGIELSLPFSQAPELVMDILRHGSHVRVIAPDDLREAVAAELRRASANYF